MISGAKLKQKQIKRSWHLIDANDKILGRLSSQIVPLLMGKNKSYYVPHLDCGDYVVVTNAKNVKLTGNKEKQKIYFRHSGYPGGLKAESLEKLRERKSEEIIEKAVWGMLPKTKLGRQMVKKLYVYSDENHPHKDKFANS